MWMVWTGGNDRFWDQHDRLHLRRLRPAEDRQLASRAWLHARQPLELPRPGQRALLRERRRRPTRTGCGLWLDVRGKDCARRSVRGREQVSRRRDRRARQAARRRHDAAGRLVLRLCHRHRRPAPVPQPGLRREGRQGAGTPERYYTDPSYYNRKDLVRPYRVGMSCGFCHVGPSPVQPAGRSGASGVRQPQLVGRRAVHVGRPAVHLQREQARGPQELHVPAGPHLPAGQRWTPRWSRPTASTTRAP